MGVAVRMAVPRHAHPTACRATRNATRATGRRGGPPIAYVNARLLDPASGLDAPGGVLVARRRHRRSRPASLRASARLDGTRGGRLRRRCAWRPASSTCACSCASPARSTRRPSPPRAAAAAAGGVTSMVALPNTEPVIDDPSLVEFDRAARARDEPGQDLRLCRADHAASPAREIDRDRPAGRGRRASASPTASRRSPTRG